jgi:anaerobic selenocysteine-containing dehydrogenase
LRALRVHLTTVSGRDAFEEGAVSRRRIIRLNPQDAARLGIVEDELIEIDAGLAASLRGWARIDTAVAKGTSPVDKRACEILKIKVGDRIELRRILSSVRPRVAQAEAAE